MMLVPEVCRRGGGYMMLLDSDDRVSNKLANYVLTDDNRCGYVLHQDYVYDAGRTSVERIDNFDARCGSSSVFYLEPQDGTAHEFDWTFHIADTRH